MQIKADEPYVDFARAVEVSKGDIKIGEYAKILCDKDKGIDTGEIRLFALMRELGILRANNEPYQKYLDLGYFDFKLLDDNVTKRRDDIKIYPVDNAKRSSKVSQKAYRGDKN